MEETEEIDTSGFYRQTPNGWRYAPNGYISAAGYELKRELKDEYEYPVEGWNWYDKQPFETEQ